MSKKKKSERVDTKKTNELLAAAAGETPKDPATASSTTLTAVKSKQAEKVKLNYADPGIERKLPKPPHLTIGPGDRVKLTKAQEYADGVTVRAGEEGVALNPSSQAACWCVSFFNVPGATPRVVPEWLLEPVGPRAAHH